MANDNIYFYDHATGQEIVREMTDEEQAEREAEIVASAIRKQAEAQALAETAAKKLIAESKLRIGADKQIEGCLILGVSLVAKRGRYCAGQ